jgi:hypothetical protein
MLQEMHDYQRRGYTPKVKPTKACKSCSLMDLCFPKLLKSKSVIHYVQSKMEEKYRKCKLNIWDNEHRRASYYNYQYRGNDAQQ